MDKFIILIEIDIANLFYLKNYINEKLKIKILKKYIFFLFDNKRKNRKLLNFFKKICFKVYISILLVYIILQNH
jgi:hypothetical protein